MAACGVLDGGGQASHVALLVDAGAVGVSAAVVQFQAVRKGKQVMERIKVRGVGCALMACASSVCASSVCAASVCDLRHTYGTAGLPAQARLFALRGGRRPLYARYAGRRERSGSCTPRRRGRRGSCHRPGPRQAPRRHLRRAAAGGLRARGRGGGGGGGGGGGRWRRAPVSPAAFKPAD
eukprot:COSAG01_NODE_8255_length_2855_cov_5.639695_2_plen_180_part_00